jgi:hypothetical protein
MPYLAISRSDARTFLSARKANLSPTLPAPREVAEGPDVDWESVASDLFSELQKLASGEPVKKRGDPRGAAFEIAAGPLIHKALPTHPALGDPEFWAWLTLIHGTSLVDWRYEAAPDFANFGGGSPSENLFFRIWLRAEIAYAPESADPYELVGVGDIDFWRSHIFRQSYADARGFAKALLNFQFPPSEHGRKARLSINQIRGLAKHLKRARTNLLFELMDRERATGFIEAEWLRLAPSA